ncbi:mutS protein 4 [Echinococcus multilocularis]|uniref:MutS protein 4 n=1 Tax=Echinococcus multilocularis TaxID=6211 RepID=A0A068Y5C8_ECHMU|nr:mutS protein 4 [Echinococcus multilocularis]
MAAVDLNRPGIEVSQFTDTGGYGSTLMKMLVWMPTEVLLPHSALEQSSLEYLKSLCHPHYLPSIYAFQEKYYGLSAAAALLNYLERAKRVYYAPKSLKVDFGCSTQATMLDATSAIRLGLVSRLGRPRDGQTLFKAINYTCTLSGARRLRGCLLEPPNDLTTITYRQDSVAELISKPQILLEIQNVLAKFPAIDSLLSMCVHLSEFPAPRTDLLTGTATKSAAFAITSPTFRDCLTLSSGGPGAGEDLLTPSSDVQPDHRPKRPRTGTASGLNISVASVPTSNMASGRKSSVGGDSDATSSLVSAVTIGNNAELRITKLIAIKHMLDLIRPLHDALKGTSSALLKTYREILSDAGYVELLEKMTTVLHQDACVCKGTLQMRVQKCFAIKPGINVLLDLTRRAYAEQVDDISHYVKGLASEYTLPLRVGYNKARGFFIQIPEQALYLPPALQTRSRGAELASNLASGSEICAESVGSHFSGSSFDSQSHTRRHGLPEVFIKVQVARGLINCTTAELVKLNERVKGSLNEVYLIADNLACKLIHDLHPEMSLFYRLSEAVSGLDLLCSLARIVISAPPGHCFVKPVFGDTLAIQEGRHMINDRFGGCLPVSNNTFASASQNVLIILGTSMSGKTTYLTQVALMQILAQIGSFVPAKFAAFRLTDKIFVRMGCRDDMSTNASAFALEMREVGHMLRSATDNSLVLIDDLGLSTTDEDCFSLSYAICDALAKMRAFSFFTSSDASLSQLQFVHLNVEICHFEVETRGTMQGGRRIHQPGSANSSSEESVASTSFDESFQLPARGGRAPAVGEGGRLKGDDKRTLYRFTYRLKKGVGKGKHSIINQIELTALDPDLINITKKYYNILMSGKTSATDVTTSNAKTSGVFIASNSTVDPAPMPGSEQLRRAGPVTSKGNQEEAEDVIRQITLREIEGGVKQAGNQTPPLDQHSSATKDKEQGALPKTLNLDVDEGTPTLPTSTPLAPTQPPTNQTSKGASTETHSNKGNGGECSSQENGGGATDSPNNKDSLEGGGLSSVDRMAHRLMQQVQMLACVVRCVERTSVSTTGEASTQKEEEERRVRAAKQDVLYHLSFLRDRYAAVLKGLEED